jgi:hypothetical protein
METTYPSPKMFIQNFRAASEGLGKFCQTKNELRIRKGRKLHLFTCREYELRFVAPGQTEVVILLASDATAHEFRRSITNLIASLKQ